MEKISGILPTSSRIQAIDTSKSQPARPGAPTLGRSEGKNSLGAAKAVFSKEAEMAALKAEIDGVPSTPAAKLYKKPTEADHAKIAEDVSRRFFKSVKDDIYAGADLGQQIENRFEEISE